MGKRYALVFDLRRCIGCHTCTIACKLENNVRVGSRWISVLTIGGRHIDTPKGKYPKLSMYWQPITCMHCDKPLCMDSCPANAIYKRDDGIVLIDKDKCTGCLECQPACPYEAIQYNPEKGIVEKCTLCNHRIEQGLEPFCAKECVWGAIYFGDIEDSQSKVSLLISQRNGYTLKPEKGTSPSVYYLPP